MNLNISHELNAILRYARDEAMRTGAYAITADHLMLAILRHADNDACRTLSEMGADLGEMKRFIDDRSFTGRNLPYSEYEKLGVGKSARNAISMAGFEALRDKAHSITACHLLLACSRIKGSATVEYINLCGLSTSSISEHLRLRQIPAGPVKPSGAAISQVVVVSNSGQKGILS